MHYSIEKTKKLIYNYVNDNIEWSDNDDKTNSINIINITKNLCSMMLYNSVFYKNPYFNEEEEWRLVYSPFGNIRGAKRESEYFDIMSETFILSKEGDFTRKPMSFKLKDNKIISYYDLDFLAIKKIFIKEITIGSKADIDDLDLKLFLSKEGYNPLHIRILKSNIPYR